MCTRISEFNSVISQKLLSLIYNQITIPLEFHVSFKSIVDDIKLCLQRERFNITSVSFSPFFVLILPNFPIYCNGIAHCKIVLHTRKLHDHYKGSHWRDSYLCSIRYSHFLTYYVVVLTFRIT